jgi:hypothetical protein
MLKARGPIANGHESSLKIAIIRTGKTQRQISIEARLGEVRLSELIRGRGWPSSTERTALANVLGADYFADAEAAEARQR